MKQLWNKLAAVLVCCVLLAAVPLAVCCAADDKIGRAHV